MSEAVKIFDINNYLQKNRVVKDNRDSVKNSNSFYDVVDQIKEHFNEKYNNDSINPTESQRHQEIEHKAIQGDSEAEQIITDEIQSYLRNNNLLGVKYPDFFDSLSQAIFHEIYRFGAFYKWEKYPHSPSAKIQGTEIWFKIDGEFQRQEESLRSIDQFDEIIKALQVSNKGLKLNEANPEAEVELKNGTRVTIAIPPRCLVPTIVFRRFIVSNFSFLEQAKRGTISIEDVDFFENLAKLNLNTIIAGHVESGKSTLLKTFYGARDPKKVALLIESSPETYLKRDFPDRLVHDFYTKDGNIEQVIRTAMRVDHHYVIFQEVRGVEAEGAMKGTERGTRGLLMTYHITDPANTPQQLAQHIVDEYQNRRLGSEIRRVAKQLDIGITMETLEGNKKKVQTIYELCYDYKNDRCWINYLMKYNKAKGIWEYNSNVSEQLKERMVVENATIAQEVLAHLDKKSKESPLISPTEQEIFFKE